MKEKLTERDIEKLKKLRFYLLDMDGTTYLGNRVFPGTLKFLDLLRKQGKKFLFLTNNSSQDAEFYAQKLQKMGIDVSAQEVFTSGEATVRYITSLKRNPRVFPLGTPSFERELEKAGCILTDENPDFVVLGFDKTLTYEKVKKACLLLREGIKYIASHPDINCPTEEGLIPDAGAIIALIKASTGREPDIIIGKPRKEFIYEALKKMDAKREESAIVGDRLYTDIRSGLEAGITSILVLTGETKLEDLSSSPYQPTFVLDSLEELAEIISN